MIFITGGTGFLGRHLVPTLCRAGLRGRVLARDPQQATWLSRYPNIEIVQGDLTHPEDVRCAMTGCNQVIHAGGYFRFWGKQEDFDQINVQGTQHMLDAALAVGIERFVHISTIAVIGNPPQAQIIDETYPALPADPYQRSKLAGEQLIQEYHERFGLPAIILRPGAYYGPLGEYAFNRLFFRDPLRGIIMQINGGSHIIFPAYIADVVAGVLSALERGRTGEIYNICGDWLSHKEAFDIVCEEANLHWPRPPIPGWLGIYASRILELLAIFTRREPFWPINLRSYVYNNWRISNEKARNELAFAPTDFRLGAKRTIAWYRAGKPDDIPEAACD